MTLSSKCGSMVGGGLPGRINLLRLMAVSFGPLVEDSCLNKNMALDIPSQETDSNIALNSQPGNQNHDQTGLTLEPYEFKFPKKKKSFRPNPMLQHFESLFGIDNWSRYLVLKTSNKITSAKLENILLSHYSSKEMSFRLIKPNEWLIHTTTKAQSEIYQSLNEIEGIDVSVKKHDTLNSIQGTIILPNIDDEHDLPNKDLLLDSLKKRYSNVQDLEIYEIPSRNNSRTLRIGKIKFEGQVLPDKIKIQGQSCELRPFIPKPLQCKMCSKFGHTDKKCRGNPVCAYCSSEDHLTKWNCGTPKCINCGLEHHARSKQCAFFTYNTELKLLVDRTGMSIREAKLELKARGFQDPARNPLFKNKVRNIIPQKALNIYKDNIMNKKSKETINPAEKIDDPGKESVLTYNFFNILSDNLEDVTSDNSQSEVIRNEVAKEKADEIVKKKRTFEKLSPIKTNDNVNRSVRPKIIRENAQRANEISDKDEEITPSLVLPTKFKNTNEEITPSPVFPTKLKNTNAKTLDKKYQSTKCFTKQADKQSTPTHSSTCGCHDCFVKECLLMKPLSKDKLINIIRNFLANKELLDISELESHQPDCMCKHHLIFYKKNKIAVLDRFISKQNCEENSPSVSTD